MGESILSAHWYRISGIRLSLRSHVRIHRHTYRGDVWYILQDELSGKQRRFNESAYRFIRLIDGSNTVNDIWTHLDQAYGDDAPTQDEIIQLLGSLYYADCILGDLPSDVEEIIDRRRKQRRKLFTSKIANPLSIRVPLIDPDRYLTHWSWLVRPVFSKAALIAFVTLMLVAFVEAWRNWGDISAHAGEVALQPSNLLVILLVYPLIKSLHELSHAFAVKHWGGEVHELGVMFLVFMPVPYVDASAATAFQSKYRRMMVAACGIVAELVLASVALLLWLNVQDGLFSEILFNIMLIGGVSTLLFNGNPLLRYDGYFVFSDAIEIPGLATRSNRYIGYLVQRYLLKAVQAKSPETGVGEKFWFVSYGLAAFVYRMMIMFAIVLYMSSEYFFIGVVLGIWMVMRQIIVPIVKAMRYVFSSTLLEGNRARAMVVSLAMIAMLALFLFTLPMPLNTMTEGVVWMPEKSHVRAGSDGFVTSVASENGDRIEPMQPLVTTEDVTLTDELTLMQARLAELRGKYDAVRQTDRVKAEIINDEIRVMQGSVSRMQERLDEMTVASQVGGVFVLPETQQLQGHYVKQGDTMAYVIDFDDLSVRVVVPQNAIGLVRKQTRRVQLRLVGDIGHVYESSVIREIPAATYKLPSKALAVDGGGRISTNPFDEEGVRTKDQYFQFDVSLPEQIAQAYIGQRVYVKFSHGYEALALQWYRNFSELFLDELGKV